MRASIRNIHIIDGALLFIEQHHMNKPAPPERRSNQHSQHNRNRDHDDGLSEALFLIDIEKKQRQDCRNMEFGSQRQGQRRTESINRSIIA